MNIHIKANNIELTDAIRAYVEKRLESLKKFVKDDSVVVYVEVGKTTAHHKSGDIFKSEVNFDFNGKNFHAISEQSDLYAAIDDTKEELSRTLVSFKDKRHTLFKRGASSVKKMLKGISKRNPFTSKYE